MAGVSAERALSLAAELSEQRGIKLGSPWGIASIGLIVREWLEELLPEDAGPRLSGRIGVVVRDAKSGRARVVTAWTTKSDVIDCLCASTHIPILSRGLPACSFRGQPTLDACFVDPRKVIDAEARAALGLNGSRSSSSGEEDEWNGTRMWEVTFSDDQRNSPLAALSLPCPKTAREWARRGAEMAESRLTGESPLPATTGCVGGLAASVVHGFASTAARAITALARAAVAVDEISGAAARRRQRIEDEGTAA